MNRKKIHKMLIKIGIGILLIFQITGQIAMATMGTGMIDHNINHFGNIPKSQVECCIKTTTNNKIVNKDIKTAQIPKQTNSNLTQYGEKNMLTGKTSGQYASHSWYLNRLNNLATAYGKELHIYSGYRSVELQQQLFNQSDRTGKMVAMAGHSRHNVGLAIDCDSKWVTELNNKQLAKFGLYKPMNYENWHLEPIETKGKSTSELIARYGTPPDVLNCANQISSNEAELKEIIDKEMKRVDIEINSIKKEIQRLEILKSNGK